MAELKDYGTVVTSDVLIIGGGTGGTVSALKLKKLDPDLDVLIIEQGFYGYKGQSTKAGHGIFHMAPEDDIDEFCEDSVRHNAFGLYLNDQDYMYDLTREAYTYLAEMEDLGAVFAHNEDGSFHYHREFAIKKCHDANIDLDFIRPLSDLALEAGVRVAERIYFTDLLTRDGKCVGAVGFNMDTLEFVIFCAKAVILAANAFNPVVTGMFFSPATGTIAAWRAGAQLRNPEQATYCDMGFRNTKNFMYGVHWALTNKLGENIFQKYGCTDYENVEPKLVRGMIEEARLGNNPLYIDFSALPQTSQTEGEGFFMGMVMPTRLDIDDFIHSRMALAQEGGDHLANPEVSLTPYIMTECLQADIDAKTTLPGLWAIGTISALGAGHGAWVHGDGVGLASRTGLLAAKSIAREIGGLERAEPDLMQVEEYKLHVYEPLGYDGPNLPYQVVHELDRQICQPENNFFKTEQTIHAMIDGLEKARADLPHAIHVPEGNSHHLSKAIEARAAIDMLEIMYMAYDMRKETRGYHIRYDYPERDDRHYLKRIVVNRGSDGRPAMGWERIPFERYKYKPEGWTPDWEKDMEF